MFQISTGLKMGNTAGFQETGTAYPSGPPMFTLDFYQTSMLSMYMFI